MVMSKVWDEVLLNAENLLVPPLFESWNDFKCLRTIEVETIFVCESFPGQPTS